MLIVTHFIILLFSPTLGHLQLGKVRKDTFNICDLVIFNRVK